MIDVRRFVKSWPLLSAWLVACARGSDASNGVEVTSAALSACNETVPDNRYIDGVPAYAQCDATQSSAIYSNNGIDTATAAAGSDWVRTQSSGGYQCTELAHRYLYFKWQVKWIPNGNAGAWCDSTPPANSGITQTMTPVHGDIMVLAPGSCGADATTGHVTVVDSLDATKARLTVVEQNGARRGQYMQTCGKCFLHVIANDGTNPGATITPSPPSGAAGAAAGSSAPVPAAGVGAGASSRRPAPAGSAAPMQPTAAGRVAPPTGMQPPSAGAAAAVAGSSASLPPTAAGSAALTPPTTTMTTTPAPSPSVASDGGCSVSRALGAVRSPQPWVGLLYLAMAYAARLRRRSRRLSV
jgi:hypothetical protein